MATITRKVKNAIIEATPYGNAYCSAHTSTGLPWIPGNRLFQLPQNMELPYARTTQSIIAVCSKIKNEGSEG
jgi:hypothetical protein